MNEIDAYVLASDTQGVVKLASLLMGVIQSNAATSSDMILFDDVADTGGANVFDFWHFDFSYSP